MMFQSAALVAVSVNMQSRGSGRGPRFRLSTALRYLEAELDSAAVSGTAMRRFEVVGWIERELRLVRS